MRNPFASFVINMQIWVHFATHDSFQKLREVARLNYYYYYYFYVFIYLFIYFVPLGDGKMGRASQPLCTGAGVGGQT